MLPQPENKRELHLCSIERSHIVASLNNEIAINHASAHSQFPAVGKAVDTCFGHLQRLKLLLFNLVYQQTLPVGNELMGGRTPAAARRQSDDVASGRL